MARFEPNVPQGFGPRVARRRVAPAGSARLGRFAPCRAVGATAFAFVFLALAVRFLVHVAPRRHEVATVGNVAKGRAVRVARVHVVQRRAIGEGERFNAETVDVGRAFGEGRFRVAGARKDATDGRVGFVGVAGETDRKERGTPDRGMQRRYGAGRLGSHGNLLRNQGFV